VGAQGAGALNLRWAVLAACLAWGIVPDIGIAQAPRLSADLRARGCCIDEVADGDKVSDLKIAGNKALSNSEIRNAIFTTETGSFPWSKKHFLDKSQFLDDLQRIYILYQRNGYFAFELESYEIQLRDGDVEIRLSVLEGAPTLVDEVELEGFGTIDGQDLETELRDRLPMRVGEVFKEEDLIASRDMLENEFKNRGFAFAQVLLEYRIRKTEQTATVTYSVDPGGVYYFGQIDVSEAVDSSDEDLVRTQLTFNAGDRYEQRAILDSQRRIYELGLFRLVEVDTKLGAVRADTVDVAISVTPAPTRVVRLGVGYGTEVRGRVQGSWLDRNFFGKSRQLEIRGLYSRLEREGAITYRQPTFIIPNLNLSVSAFLRFENEDTYTVERIGATGRVAYRLSRSVVATGAITAERANFSEFDEGVLIPELGRDFINPSRLLYTDLGVTFDNTDSLFSPTRGYRATLDYQLGIPVGQFDYAYNKITVQVAHYFELRDGWVMAGRVLPGAIFTYGGDPETGGEGRVPLFQRLFAGGSTSVRGYERRQLGPKDDPASFGQTRDPDPIGGSGLLETGVELRFPIGGRLRGVAFVDAGNVWGDPSEISLSDLEYTPGAGVRYVTPIGPFRFDFARRTSDEESFLPRWVFHISIGDAY
jgi:outer membrane protein assembly complex protein YaeT